MIGHPQGASGACGVVTSALMLTRRFAPPTINHTNPDPDCDLDFVPNTGRPAEAQAALCNCLGFWLEEQRDRVGGCSVVRGMWAP